jgi:hypothetical protein
MKTILIRGDSGHIEFDIKQTTFDLINNYRETIKEDIKKVIVFYDALPNGDMWKFTVTNRAVKLGNNCFIMLFSLKQGI